MLWVADWNPRGMPGLWVALTGCAPWYAYVWGWYPYIIGAAAAYPYEGRYICARENLQKMVSQDSSGYKGDRWSILHRGGGTVAVPGRASCSPSDG